jgi:hypothetical protein
MMNTSEVKRIPYGIGDYRRLREDNAYYVDKTHFIPVLEAAPYYLFLIRPRRFGKTLWLSVLQHYYDIAFAEQFDALFGGTYIGEHPTPARNSYLVMMFNFSVVNPDVRYVQQSFEANGESVVRAFLRWYEPFFDQQEQQTILAYPRTEDKLREIFALVSYKGLKLYLFIDEYDNFANTILTTQGQAAYHELTHGAGFFRYFFNLLKGATSGQMSGLTRLFITGVSPVTMDDVTSGFNIGRNLSLMPHLNTLLGFTEAETRALLTYYHEAGWLAQDAEAYWPVLQEWYGRYRFAQEATEYLLNPDMVLYFVDEARGRATLPQDLLDPNVRTDYGKLRHLLTVDRQLNGNFSRLREIIETGETTGRIVTGFPLERLTSAENFLSLLYYMGLLTFDGIRDGLPVLRVPNLTIRELVYGYLREGYYETGVFRINVARFAQMMGRMAYHGEWQPVFEFLAQEIEQQASVRDYLGGEKMVQGFLLAYLNVTNFFLTWSERELGGGPSATLRTSFVDMYLEPFLARYPNMQYGYLIELKYIPKSEYTPAVQAEKIQQARAQLAQYANDARVQAVASAVKLVKLVLVYKGWELVYCEALDKECLNEA